MKKILLLACILMSGCSGGKSENSGVKSTAGKLAPDLSRAFNDTTRVDQPTLLELLHASVTAGQALNSIWAERCWQKEQTRPEVVASCLIAWSIAPQKSELLEKEIARLAPTNHAAAVAAVRSETPLARLSEGELRQVLQLLADDPVWLRAKAILAWRQAHGAPGIVENEAWHSLLAADQSVAPADFRFGYLAAKSLDPNKSMLLLGQHCSVLVVDELRTDCWRFISAFLDASGANPLLDELTPWLPAPDRAWSVFRLNWPERARLLERQPPR